MLKGTYIFYENGKEICRSSNLITKFGKRFLTNFMAGNVSFNSKELALGIATSSEYALADTNSRLGFEFTRVPVDFGSTNIQPDGAGGFTYSVIYKGTIPQTVSGKINEVGLYPTFRVSSNLYSDKFISDFENNLIWTNSLGLNPDLVTLAGLESPRIGLYFVKIITNAESSSQEYIANTNSLDISGYSVNDTLTMAFYQEDVNLNNIKIRLYSSDVDYFEATFDSDGTVGNKILETTLSDMLLNPVGTPISDSINKVGVVVSSNSSGATSVYLDGLRINDEDKFDPAYGIISRSIITDGLNKVLGRTVDIEYRLELF